MQVGAFAVRRVALPCPRFALTHGATPCLRLARLGSGLPWLCATMLHLCSAVSLRCFAFAKPRRDWQHFAFAMLCTDWIRSALPMLCTTLPLPRAVRRCSAQPLLCNASQCVAKLCPCAVVRGSTLPFAVRRCSVPCCAFAERYSLTVPCLRTAGQITTSLMRCAAMT